MGRLWRLKETSKVRLCDDVFDEYLAHCAAGLRRDDLAAATLRSYRKRVTLPGCICRAEVLDRIASRLMPEDLPKALRAAKHIDDSACEALLTPADIFLLASAIS